jgi:ATP-binding cassette, subfamily B, bacterial MsbA
MSKEEKDLSSLQLYKRLLSYVLPYIPQFIVSILGFAIYSGSQVAATEWLKRVIDYVNDPVGDFRIILPILLIIIALIRGVGFFIGNYLLASISNRLVHNLRTELFTKLTVLPSSFFDSQTSGHLISRITFNVMQVTGAATNALKIFIREGLLVIGLITYLMFLNWKLALFLFIAAPFIAVIVGFAAKRLRSISGKIQTAMGDVTHVASEAINGYREVKSFGGERYEIDRFKNASDNNRKQNLKLEATNSIASPLVQIFVSAALALITWLALDTSIVNEMTPGTFIAFFSAAGMLAKPVRQLSEINSQIQKGLAAASDIFIQLDEEPEKNNGTYTSDEIKGRISFKDVSFSYSQDVNRSLVLSKINLEIQEGETVAFVGKSGAGKTSLLSLIPRFYEQSEGEILIDDVSINDYEIKNLRSHISLVSQDVTLFNDTIFNNISYGMKDADLTSVQEAAKKANAHDFIQAMPDGYSTLAGDDGVLLSGGQRQRIAIARAVLKNSPFLILDEATSALDSESENVIQDALQLLTKDRTTLVIAHRLSTIENADKIVVLNDGVIAEVGTHLDLLKNNGIYTELHNNQFKDQPPEISTKNVPEIKKDFAAVETNQSGFLENSWNQKSSWLFILWPLSLITKYISLRRRKNYLTDKSKSWKSDIPIIVVGNIVVGGTGKTPVVIWLAKALKKMGFKPGIISRGYGGKAKNYPLSVDEYTSVKDCGDEPKIIAFNTGCPVYVSPNRVQAAKQLSEKEDIDFIISDDGMQHYQIDRDIEIAVFDGTRGTGNNLCLPAGPLREPLSRAREVDFIVSSTQSMDDAKIREDYIMNLQPLEWVRISDGERFLPNSWPLVRAVHAVAGIGNPSKFFSLLRELGLEPIEHSFPDHYQFTKSDLLFGDNLPIVMTEKDSVRCHDIDIPNLWFLKVESDLPGEFAEKILLLLKQKKEKNE